MTLEGVSAGLGKFGHSGCVGTDGLKSYFQHKSEAKDEKKVLVLNSVEAVYIDLLPHAFYG